MDNTHGQGVVHRDLKPSNILLEHGGRPKVIDFGVARLTHAGQLSDMGLTRTGQLLGTPNYMSHEQVIAVPTAVDQRTDVYALGVIVFEMLTGRLPYTLDHKPLGDVIRRISDDDPPLLGDVAPALRGDLETIVARALEKSPARRYQSAAELAADIRRYLAREPILARPASTPYRVSKFVRRYRVFVGGVAATRAALLLGLVGTTVFAVGEARQRERAEQNAVESARHAEESARLATEASDRYRDARFQEYRARMTAAFAALSVNDVEDAKRQLDRAPEELRGWEWHHAAGRLDDSSTFTLVPRGFPMRLLGAPRQLRVTTFDKPGVRLVDLDGGRERVLPIGPANRLRVAVADTAKGLRVAAWARKDAVELIDEAGGVLTRFEVPKVDRRGFIFLSPDGTRLAYPWADGDRTRLTIFNANSPRTHVVSDAHLGRVYDCTFNSSGTVLASAGNDSVIRLWDTTSGELLAECRLGTPTR